MLTLFVAVLASAAPDGLALTPDAPPPEPRLVLYGSPVSTAAAAAMAATSSTGGLYVPIGATIRAVDHLAFSVDLSAAIIDPAWQFAGWSVYAAAGPTYFFETGHVDGLFITFKGAFQQLHAPRQALLFPNCAGFSCPIFHDDSRAFLAALDVGYTWRVHSFTISAVLGLAAGYQQFQSSAMTTPFDSSTSNSDGFAWSVNFNFLRVGYAL